VPFADFYSHRLKAFRALRFLDIRTGHKETEIAQHLSEPAHADAAYPDEMNSFYVSEH
jgi:hypothetical protein